MTGLLQKFFDFFSSRKKENKTVSTDSDKTVDGEVSLLPTETENGLRIHGDVNEYFAAVRDGRITADNVPDRQQGRWSSHEEKVLIEAYGTFRDRVIADGLGRSKTAIQMKAKRLLK